MALEAPTAAGMPAARRGADWCVGKRRDSVEPVRAELTSTSVDAPDLAFHHHTVGLERILCRAAQHGADTPLNCAPWYGHVTVDPSSVPSLSGPCLCVHLSCVAQKPPLTWKRARSPTNKADPGRNFADAEFVLLESSIESAQRPLRAEDSGPDSGRGAAEPVLETRLTESRVIAGNECAFAPAPRRSSARAGQRSTSRGS